MNINFEDIEDELLSKLEKTDLKKYGINEKVNYLKGFTAFPIRDHLEDKLTLRGKCLPTVMLIGVETGIIYHFALMALLDIN